MPTGRVSRLPRARMVHHQQVGGLFQARYTPFAAHIAEGRPTDEAGEEFVVFNPATSEELCTVEAASKADVHRTVEHAHETSKSGAWSQASAHQRAVVLSRLARSLEERVPQFAQIETLQTGRAIREMRAQLGRLPEWLEYFASLLRTNQAFVAPTQGQLLNYVQRVPLGVVAQITPFNHPLLIAVKKIAPALAAGNSVIVKPSEGVLSVLPGYGRTTGVELVSHPLVRKVDITAPIIVFNDADLESAVNGAAFASFIASGQTCVSGTRLIIHSSIYDRFMEMFVRKVIRIMRRMGSPNNPRSSMGSVISPLHLEHIHEMVQARSSGTLLVGGEPMTGVSPLDGFDFAHGSFYPPTVIADVSTDDQIWKEEIFGPVVVVKQFTDEAEGVELANDSRYGLGAGIWTQDLSRAHRIAERLESGLVWVNTHHRNDPSSPWGGMKESGIGRENGLEALNAYSQSKSVIINTASAEDSRLKDDWFSEENYQALPPGSTTSQALGCAQLISNQIAQGVQHFNDAHLVPDVVHSFNPSAILDVTFTDPTNNQEVQLVSGMELSTNQTLHEPKFFLTFDDQSLEDKTFVLAMVDPDAPTPQNTSLAQVRHIIAGDIHVSPGSNNHSQLVNSSAALTEYLNPSPPPGSDPHRYTILLFTEPDNFAAQASGLINSSADAVRTGFNLSTFASHVGLGDPVAGTFFLTRGPPANSSAAASSSPSPSASTTTARGNANGIIGHGQASMAVLAGALVAFLAVTVTF
ncbi:hypothetical protein EVG20_g4530 [Dentipellis fragilis]|uniref:Aldehyde dehydrogenase domain-containing protein n=1 Tax=Dentipellis fragilis TaxID=205917 RepID=A0A4Y9YVV4_9AGAM|nr:hypothetical protein EVG20_g4530 [Dentipellis fragilis]